MADDERQQPEAPDPASAEADAEEEAPSTPFDHPFFLPILLTAFALWFGYDGWFNPDIKAVKFNQYGFVILSVAAIYYTVRAVRERRSWDCTQCGAKNPHDASLCGKCGGAPA